MQKHAEQLLLKLFLQIYCKFLANWFAFFCILSFSYKNGFAFFAFLLHPDCWGPFFSCIFLHFSPINLFYSFPEEAAARPHKSRAYRTGHEWGIRMLFETVAMYRLLGMGYTQSKPKIRPCSGGLLQRTQTP